jgi:hypothetical protein
MHAHIKQYAKMLRNLDAWIEKAVAHAQARKFDPEVLVQARLAPDQYAFARQVQAACDSVKFAAAYLSGKEAPSHPDTETTLAELRARIGKCLAFVEGIPAADFSGAEERKISPPWLRGGWLTGAEYLFDVSMPNTYFHLTTAYAILRHNGVDLGKMDFMGSIPVKAP